LVRAIVILAAAVLLGACSTLTGDRPWLPSPYPHPAEYDVWVRGEYVGSDPDPRIRATLRQEWKRSHNLR
jgi:hypothetical protein